MRPLISRHRNLGKAYAEIAREKGEGKGKNYVEVKILLSKPGNNDITGQRGSSSCGGLEPRKRVEMVRRGNGQTRETLKLHSKTWKLGGKLYRETEQLPTPALGESMPEKNL